MSARRTDSKLVRLIGSGAVVLAVAGGLLAIPPVHAAVTNKINGSSIAAHSIAGNRLKNNTVTGKQIKESTLGAVPEAKKLGGVPASGYLRTSREFTYYRTMTDSQSPKVLGKFGPLTFTASCTFDIDNNGGFPTVTVSTSKAIHFLPNGASADLPEIGPGSPTEVEEGLATDSNAATVVQLDAYTDDGSFALAPNSTMVAVEGTGATSAGCVFYGQLENVGH